MSWSVDVFHVGPQKTGTTWVYRCFREHPEIATPGIDTIHYYSMLFHKGEEWYRRQFSVSGPERITFDPTPDYLRSPLVPGRIAADNPHAKIIVCLREPIERAYSHYWHEKKKNRFNFEFSEVLDNFDLFTNWVEPGFYSAHIERFLQYFPREQVKVVMFDDLEKDPAAFIKDLFDFVGVDPNFVPSIVNQKVNVATPRHNATKKFLKQLLGNSITKTVIYEPVKHIIPLWGRASGADRSAPSGLETLQDVDRAVVQELSALFETEFQKLESMLELDLKGWRDRYRDRLKDQAHA